MTTFRAAVVTISDTAAADHTADRSGPLLASTLRDSGYISIEHHVICPDDTDDIQTVVCRAIDVLLVDLVITTGGTGFGLRDVTPEALEPLFTRKTPALTHALTAHSLRKTPLAALSRGVTGIRAVKGEKGGKEALIVALPGSPKAVKECLEILLWDGLLKHALELLSGGKGEGKHKEMQGEMHRSSSSVATATDTGHAHTHHHHHHHHHPSTGGLHSHSAPKPRTTVADHAPYRTISPSSGPSLRHRISPYPLLPLSEALSLIATYTPPPTQTTTLPLSPALIGHVLAEPVSSPTDLPPGPTTNVDGYAVNSSATPPGEHKVLTLKTLSGELGKGEVFRINTGQGLPKGTDAVVMVEDTALLQSSEQGEELTIKVLAQVDSGENVRPKGSDVKAEQIVLPKGTTITALGGEIGTLAFLGRSNALVYRKPKVAILSTGNELLDPSPSSSPSTTSPWGFGVFDSNRPSLSAAISGLGFPLVDLGIVKDDASSTLSSLRSALSQAEVVITTGGTSMGESDLLKPLLERDLGATIHFGRVAMKPGKPTTFATLDEAAGGVEQGRKLIFALPGNPASALVTFYVFVLPALRKLSGYPPSSPSSSVEGNPWSLPKVKVNLGTEMKLDSRPEFHRAIIKAEGGVLKAYSTGSQRSSGMHSMASANGLIALPALKQGEGRKKLGAGEEAEAVILGSIV